MTALDLRNATGKSLLSVTETACELGLEITDLNDITENGGIQAIALPDGRKMYSVAAIARFLEADDDNKVDDQQECALSSTQAQHWKEVIAMRFTGSVTTTKTGRHIAQIQIGKKADGTRMRVSKSFDTREMADSFLAQRLIELNREQHSDRNVKTETSPPDFILGKSIKMKMDEYFMEFLSLELGSATTRTISGYKRDLKVFFDIYVEISGHNPSMCEVTAEGVRRTINTIAKDYRQSVLNKCWTTSKRALVYAFEEGYIAVNPFRNFKKPKSKKLVIDSNRTRVFTEDELLRIMEAAKTHPLLYAALSIMRATGIRPGELRVLRWQDLDRQNRTIVVQAAASREYKNTGNIHATETGIALLATTKNGVVRTCKLTLEALDAVEAWRVNLIANQNQRMKTSRYIFPNESGSFMGEWALDSALDRFIRRHKLQDIKLSLYRFRHTFCTERILEGYSVPTVAKLMGDKSDAVISRIYTHIMDSDIMGIADKIHEKENEAYQKRIESDKK